MSGCRREEGLDQQGKSAISVGRRQFHGCDKLEVRLLDSSEKLQCQCREAVGQCLFTFLICSLGQFVDWLDEEPLHQGAGDPPVIFSFPGQTVEFIAVPFRSQGKGQVSIDFPKSRERGRRNGVGGCHLVDRSGGVLGAWEDCLLYCDLSVSYFMISVLPGPRVLSWPREH